MLATKYDPVRVFDSLLAGRVTQHSGDFTVVVCWLPSRKAMLLQFSNGTTAQADGADMVRIVGEVERDMRMMGLRPPPLQAHRPGRRSYSEKRSDDEAAAAYLLEQFDALVGGRAVCYR